MTSAPKSSVLLEIEVPAERLDRAVVEAVHRLSRRTRIPGFRPGKAPRVMLERFLGPVAVIQEAVDFLVDQSYVEALNEKNVVPLARPEVEMVQAEEGKALIYKATVQVRPEVKLGDYKSFDFEPVVEVTDEEKIDKVVEELREQQASLKAVEGRAAQTGDYAVVAFEGTKDGVAFEGGTSERVPFIIGEGRLLPGFEEAVVGLERGAKTEFDVTAPESYPAEELRGQVLHFKLELKELRERVLPVVDDAFAAEIGDFETVAAMREQIRHDVDVNALDRARHDFADKIIDHAIEGASFEVPEVLVDQEVEVMHDEFKSSLQRQGLSEEMYFNATGQTSADLHMQFRPQAEKRVKVLLVLSKIAALEGVEPDEADVEAQVEMARQRYTGSPKLIAYFESDRGRSYIRGTMRRSMTVQRIVDNWLHAHPDHVLAKGHVHEDHTPSPIEDLSFGAAHAIAESEVPGTVDGEPGTAEIAAEAQVPAEAAAPAKKKTATRSKAKKADAAESTGE